MPIILEHPAVAKNVTWRFKHNALKIGCIVFITADALFTTTMHERIIGTLCENKHALIDDFFFLIFFFF